MTDEELGREIAPRESPAEQLRIVGRLGPDREGLERLILAGRAINAAAAANDPALIPPGVIVRRPPARRRRKVAQGRTRVAGVGLDGAAYGVTTLTVDPGARRVHRKEPCPTCPWRLDAKVGAFPAEAFRISADVAYDQSFNTFSCHESGAAAPATCAGFLLANAANNIGVRLALASGRLSVDGLTTGGAELYGSYREMAVANGVDPDDEILAPCRGDDEDGRTR